MNMQIKHFWLKANLFLIIPISLCQGMEAIQEIESQDEQPIEKSIEDSKKRQELEAFIAEYIDLRDFMISPSLSNLNRFCHNCQSDLSSGP